MQNQNKAYLLAFIAIFFWSTMSSAFKISLQYINLIHLLLMAVSVSIFILFLLLCFQKKTQALKNITKRDILNSALLGMLNPFLYYLILFKAYTLLKAQEAGSINYAWPVILVLLSIPMLKQRITIKSLLAICISFVGIIVISSQGGMFTFEQTNITGVILALGSSFFWAMFWILNMKDPREEISKLFLNFLFAFIYILLSCIFFTEFKTPPIKAVLGAVYIGLFEMGITYVLWLKALKLSVNTAKISNIVYLSPFLALFFIRHAVGEIILPSTVIGLILVVSGIFLQKYIDPPATKASH